MAGNGQDSEESITNINVMTIQFMVVALFVVGVIVWWAKGNPRG